MTDNQEIEKNWEIISSISNIEERIIHIYNDVKKKRPKYKKIIEENPYRLFKLLGGDESEIIKKNWAFEYSYEQYISDNEIEYDAVEAALWNLKDKSIKNAYDTGHWYVTGTCRINGPNDIVLEFEIEFCEGYFGGIIGTPYNKCNHGNHGILFF